MLTERRRCHLGCTSINLCWLKQVERWFVLINQRAIRSGSFHNVTELENTIQDFTDCHNASASHPSGISQLRPPSTRWRASLRVILRQETRSTCGMPSRSCRGTNAQPNTRKLCRGPHEEESSQPAILQHGQAKVGLGRRPEPSMPLASQAKRDLVKIHGAHPQDVGSAQVQVATLTQSIAALTQHLKTHKKDFSSRRGLLKMVSRRRSLLRYLNRKNPREYVRVVESLGLRG